MTAKSMLPDRPPSRVKHSWRCVHRGPLLETVKTDATGRAHVCHQCVECGGDDLVDRVRAEAEREET
jgi:hypothetical protein